MSGMMKIVPVVILGLVRVDVIVVTFEAGFVVLIRAVDVVLFGSVAADISAIPVSIDVLNGIVVIVFAVGIVSVVGIERDLADKVASMVVVMAEVAIVEGISMTVFVVEFAFGVADMGAIAAGSTVVSDLLPTTFIARITFVAVDINGLVCAVEKFTIFVVLVRVFVATATLTTAVTLWNAAVVFAEAPSVDFDAFVPIELAVVEISCCVTQTSVASVGSVRLALLVEFELMGALTAVTGMVLVATVVATGVFVSNPCFISIAFVVVVALRIILVVPVAVDNVSAVMFAFVAVFVE